jgi:hypothetical protein
MTIDEFKNGTYKDYLDKTLTDYLNKLKALTTTMSNCNTYLNEKYNWSLYNIYYNYIYSTFYQSVYQNFSFMFYDFESTCYYPLANAIFYLSDTSAASLTKALNDFKTNTFDPWVLKNYTNSTYYNDWKTNYYNYYKNSNNLKDLISYFNTNVMKAYKSLWSEFETSIINSFETNLLDAFNEEVVQKQTKTWTEMEIQALVTNQVSAILDETLSSNDLLTKFSKIVSQNLARIETTNVYIPSGQSLNRVYTYTDENKNSNDIIISLNNYSSKDITLTWADLKNLAQSCVANASSTTIESLKNSVFKDYLSYLKVIDTQNYSIYAVFKD